jgi:choline dehydrogenase-like flavoprotein
MLLDVTDLHAGQTVDADLCIVGAGMAGITLARAFASSRVSVCLLEAGPPHIEHGIEALSASARNIGRPYPRLQGSRSRGIGGTGNVWGGHCVPLRAINFERHSWSPYTGWPITLTDLEPFYRRAEQTLGIDQYSCDLGQVGHTLGRHAFPFDPDRVRTMVARYVRRGVRESVRQQLTAARNIRVVTGGTVTSIDAHQDGRCVESVTVHAAGDRRVTVRARWFVMATGGIENARLLLASTAVHKAGLGNQHDLVGRFFMEHIWYRSGVILPLQTQTENTWYTQETGYRDIAWRAHLCLPDPVARELNLPDFRAELSCDRSWRVSPSVLSLRDLHRHVARLQWPSDVRGQFGNLLQGPAEALSYATGRRRPLAYRLWNNVEQAPNPDSRIALSTDRDRFGVPIATVDWRLSEVDRQGIRHAHRCIAREVTRSRFGRMFVEVPEDDTEILAGADGIGHHMGTTRMHDDPRLGVVDRHCRVHGLANLFIAGSSVFPTGGYANPTLTIVALTERLADDLKQLVTDAP